MRISGPLPLDILLAACCAQIGTPCAIALSMQALNEASLIRDSIRSIRELDPPAHEIIVVDGGSDDRSAHHAFACITSVSALRIAYLLALPNLSSCRVSYRMRRRESSSERYFCRTDKLARQAGARVVTARRGRACQMNAGAEVARGDILCFVHADSCIPRYHPPSKHHVTKMQGAFFHITCKDII